MLAADSGVEGSLSEEAQGMSVHGTFRRLTAPIVMSAIGGLQAAARSAGTRCERSTFNTKGHLDYFLRPAVPRNVSLT